ncbi:MAG: CorA family divalent cation transporter, partial [Planctomycetota bacterium]
GIYGMNFENMPELRIPWAYPVLLVVMVVAAVVMILFFRRKGWIGRGRGPGDAPPSEEGG